ncbi:hypothetical protein SELMODRAFT_90260 [Selaginella moellendorffii]|uniref:DYW domain-containing protein n=1 Tax=Selaginella moellendorffii TaxID=88036 RepID=D8RD59_SELML|nr:hypothetical protein SELMODRAFT_90260 [Selaginella moellendorffii]
MQSSWKRWNHNVSLTFSSSSSSFSVRFSSSRTSSLELSPRSIAEILAEIKACSRSRDLERGRRLHARLSGGGRGFETNAFVANSLVDMYAKCGSLVDARKVFAGMGLHKTVVSWNALIQGYVENGQAEMALKVFSAMQEQGYSPNPRTFEEVEAFGVKLESLSKGMEIHSQAAGLKGCLEDIFVANTLVDVYSKCGSMSDARRVFDRMECHDVVSWNSLLLGYGENGQGELGLELYVAMRDQGCPPCPRTFVSVLKICASLAGDEYGKPIHREAARCEVELDITLESTLVDAYSKCGSLLDARMVFDRMEAHSTVSWTVMLNGCTENGDEEMALDLFESMELQLQLEPNPVTFVAVLKACAAAAAKEAGKEIDDDKFTKYGLRPGVEHYTCTVDMLARANRLDAAVAAVRGMPYEADTATWTAVMAACCRWKNAAVAEVAFGALRAIDPGDGAAFSLMANLYGSLGMWEEQSRIEELGRSCGAPRRSGRSWWIDDKTGILHRFGAGDVGCGDRAIAAKLAEMRGWMMSGDVGGIAHNIGEEDKRGFVLCSHSERIAMACALVSSPPGTTIRIGKNLRVCGDCHAVSAVASRMERRRIVCRDARRFHVFEGGKCSCGDYW